MLFLHNSVSYYFVTPTFNYEISSLNVTKVLQLHTWQTTVAYAN